MTRARGKPNVKSRKAAGFSAQRIATRVAELGRQISKSHDQRRLDVVVNMDRGFIFAADLVRQIDAPTVCHFIREDVRDVEHSGHARREVFFGEAPELKGRDVLVIDAILDSGVTQEFLLRRLGESGPRSLRLAVLLDKPTMRRVALEPDYFGFRTASNNVWVGYGLAAPNGTGRSLPQLSSAAKVKRSTGVRGGSRRKK